MPINPLTIWWQRGLFGSIWKWTENPLLKRKQSYRYRKRTKIPLFPSNSRFSPWLYANNGTGVRLIGDKGPFRSNSGLCVRFVKYLHIDATSLARQPPQLSRLDYLTSENPFEGRRCLTLANKGG